MSLLFVGFAALFERLALKSNGSFMLLWSIPFVVAGIYLLAGSFFWDSWRRRTIYYGLADDRAIIVQKSWPASSRSVDLAGVAELNLTESQNGRGTITFGPTPSVALINHPTYTNASPAYDEIEDARSVYERILRARSETRR